MGDSCRLEETRNMKDSCGIGPKTHTHEAQWQPQSLEIKIQKTQASWINEEERFESKRGAHKEGRKGPFGFGIPQYMQPRVNILFYTYGRELGEEKSPACMGKFFGLGFAEIKVLESDFAF